MHPMLHERLFDDTEGDLAESNANYTAQLERDRLTAEFHSPMNSQNRQKRLKRPKGGASLWQDPEQVGLF